MKDLEGKGIIVTGATRGIGRAIALEAARRGANVAFNYLKSEQQADELESEIEALGVKAMPFKTDVADLKAVREMVNAVKRSSAAIDGLVNNAGLTRDKLLVMMTEEEWTEVILHQPDRRIQLRARRRVHDDEGEARCDPQHHFGLAGWSGWRVR